MMRPLRRGIISRATRCRQKNTPLALTRWMRSQSASVSSMMSARRVTPALFTRMSIWPNACHRLLHHAVDLPEVADIGRHCDGSALDRR